MIIINEGGEEMLEDIRLAFQGIWSHKLRSALTMLGIIIGIGSIIAIVSTIKGTNEQIKKAVEKLNKNMLSHSEAVFGIHEATNRVTIKIIDKDTKKVLKEIPPEKTLDMIAKVWELAGLMVDEKR